MEVIIITIESAALELAKELKKTEEYNNLRAAQARIQLDPTAQDIVMAMEKIQERIQELHAEGLPVNEEFQKLYQQQHKAAANPTLARYFQAHEAFSNLMKKADIIINDELND